VLLRHGHLFRMSERDLDRADDWFDRHGPKIVFFARMVPLARSIVSVPAGTSEMPILRFLVLTAAGSALWNALMIGLGAAFGDNYDRVGDTVTRISDAVVIVLGSNNDDQAIMGLSGGKDVPTRATPGSSAGTTEADQSAPSATRRDQRTQSAPAPAASSRSGPPIAAQRQRKVERSVFLVLETPKDKLESTADDVNQTVHRFRGIVASSSVSSNDQSGGEASYDLRIPTGRLDDALAALSELGHVVERRQDLDDITASFSSTQERLDEARAERRALLRALGNATTQARIESIRTRLRLVRAQIASAKGQMASLQRRANYSRVSVTVRGNGKAEQGGGTWSPGDAAGDALRVLEVIAGIALIALAVATPLALLGAAILFGARVTRTRRRESALDPT